MADKIVVSFNFNTELIHTDFVLSTVLVLILSAMRDQASSNGVAMKTVKVLYPNLVDIGCFPHIIDRIGEIFVL